MVAAANTWLKTLTEATIADGSSVDWANESQRVARDVVYPHLQGDNAILAGERVEALRIIDKRIARTGVRLAAVLNRAMAVATAACIAAASAASAWR